MARTNRERVLDYLRSIAPKRVTNSQIREATGIEPHQQVFQLTQELMDAGLIQGIQGTRRNKNEWAFWIGDSSADRSTFPDRGSPRRKPARTGGELTPRAFEQLARSVMSMHLGIPLTAGGLAGVPKEFDMVSPDKDTVGDAKYFTLVRGKRLPPAKFSNISEHVWLLEKTDASTTFLVFGNDRRVPLLWLERYGDLVADVDFYFLTDEGELEQLSHPE